MFFNNFIGVGVIGVRASPKSWNIKNVKDILVEKEKRTRTS